MLFEESNIGRYEIPTGNPSTQSLKQIIAGRTCFESFSINSFDLHKVVR